MLDLDPIKKRLNKLSPNRTTVRVGCVPELVAEVEWLRTLVEDLHDPDPCQRDRRGRCYSHGRLNVRPCPHKLAQDLFSEREGDEQETKDARVHEPPAL